MGRPQAFLPLDLQRRGNLLSLMAGNSGTRFHTSHTSQNTARARAHPTHVHSRNNPRAHPPAVASTRLAARGCREEARTQAMAAGAVLVVLVQRDPTLRPIHAVRSVTHLRRACAPPSCGEAAHGAVRSCRLLSAGEMDANAAVVPTFLARPYPHPYKPYNKPYAQARAASARVHGMQGMRCAMQPRRAALRAQHAHN